MFVAWFNAYPGGCCNGNFGVATSPNGTHFTIHSLNTTGKYPLVDGNALFVDDDGTAYVIYSSIEENHQISIERLTPDYLQSTYENYGFFPDTYVEGATLFKRNGIYYALYGSCCCFCRGGSGVVVFSAASITGPWTRQGA
jgi:beta-xylosidase